MSNEESQHYRFQQNKRTTIIPDNIKRESVPQPVEGDQSTLTVESKKILLFIMGIVERIDFCQTPLVALGRFDKRHKWDVQLDLSEYGAAEHGVSRTHCQLELKNNNLIVTDLGSSNGTFVSGIRLMPNQPYMLKKGDGLQLGRLPIRVVVDR